MQLKSLLVASLATLGSAAVVQERQIPEGIQSLIPTDIIDSLPTEVQGIFSQVTGFFVPLITAIPPSLASEIESVIATLPTSAYPSFLSSVISQLPPDLQSSFSNFQASLTSEFGDLTSVASLITAPTTAAPRSETVPTNTGTESEATETSAPETTEGSETTTGTTGSRTGTETGTRTTSAPTTSETPNSGSKTFVGLSVMGVAGVLGLALAL